MAYSQMVRHREEEKLIRRHIFPRVIFIYAHFAATALHKLFVSRDLISAQSYFGQGGRQRDSRLRILCVQ